VSNAGGAGPHGARSAPRPHPGRSLRMQRLSKVTVGAQVIATRRAAAQALAVSVATSARLSARTAARAKATRARGHCMHAEAFAAASAVRHRRMPRRQKRCRHVAGFQAGLQARARQC
jgi:hypothetical protein